MERRPGHGVKQPDKLNLLFLFVSQPCFLLIQLQVDDISDIQYHNVNDSRTWT